MRERRETESATPCCDPEFERAFDIIEPDELVSPLVFSSPHSGRIYPARFLAATPLDSATLRRSEDAYVDDLFASASSMGAPLLRARFPRAYLDLNREPYELDPKLFAGALPSFANTRSLRVAAGLGTIPRVVADAREIYKSRLTLEEGLQRIDSLYKPYHAALRGLMECAASRFDHAVLIDCHSMPSTGARDPLMSARGDKRRIDFVIGDRYGASASSGLVDIVEDHLRSRGYHVLRNRPYAGGFITEHYGKPVAGWHALQIEVSRGLYMDESTLQKNERFDAVARDLSQVMAAVARHDVLAEILGGDRRAAAE
ncbi:MAG: N-formylglutamate amidohydrolase [Methylocystis sp.]